MAHTQVINISTQIKFKELPREWFILGSYETITINPLDTDKIIKHIKPLNSKDDILWVFDITHNAKHKNHEKINVSNHINRTGHNPLIGNQDKIESPFIDISNLYGVNYTQQQGVRKWHPWDEGITTNCIGKYFEQHKKEHTYPSTYLCYVSIIAKALGKENICGYLINTL